MKSIAIGGVIFVLILALTVGGCNAQPIPEKPTPTAAPAVKGASVGETIIAEGRVTPLRSAALSFPIGGIVKQVPVALGDHVQTGQVLVQLDSRVLELQLAQAEANLAAAQAKLNQIENSP